MRKFAFITHPTSVEDVVRYEPGAAGKGKPIVEKIIEWLPSYAGAHVRGVRTPDGRETEGWFVMAPLMAEQMMTFPREKVFSKIMDAVNIGIELGAEIVGLGAFTGVVGDGGRTIAERSSVPVTTGNSLTIAAGVRSLFKAMNEMRVDAGRSTAVVIGSTGSIGEACVELIAPHVAKLVLVAPNETRLRAQFARLKPVFACEFSYTTDVSEAVRSGDVILTATTSTREIVEPQDLRTGAVVCELSLPHDVARRVATERPDVLVVEGGIMRVPGDPEFDRIREPGTRFDFGLPPGLALACMSETMVLALEDRIESFTLGRGIELAKVREIDAMATRCGFKLTQLRAFDRAISYEELADKRAAVRDRRAAFAQ